jgi:cell division protease FtsH
MRKFKRWIRRALLFLLIAIILSLFPRTVLGAIPFLFRLAVSIFISILHLFFFFWYLAGRVKIEVYLPGQLPYTWDDYRGHPEIVEQAKLWVELLKGSSEFEKMGGRHISGILLEGAPGSGKTYLAKVLASEAGCAFINVSTNSLLGTFVGIGPLKVMTTFRKARKLARDFGACIIYLDEIDSIGRSRTGPQPQTAGFPWGGWYGGGILNTLFIELDGLTFPRSLGWRLKRRIYKAIKRKEPKWPVPRLLVIASTNIGSVLDPALTRPGRLSHRIVIEAPTLEGVKDILTYYLEKVEKDETVSVEKCALDAIGQQPAKIAEAVNSAIAKAYARGAKKMSYLDWRHALAEETLGLRQPVPWVERDRRRLAYHEAGHAVAVYLLFKGEHRITLASIVRYGNALGHISHVPFEQLYVYSRKELEKFLKVSLAGRAAEEAFLKEEMASMKGDMKHIQALIFSMATQGFFKHLPKLDGSFTDDLQAEIETFISEKLKEVKDLLRKNQTLVSRLAQELMEREEIIGEEVEKMLSSWEEEDERKD